MITAGDTEFEPSISKIYDFTMEQCPTRIACLSADDTDWGFALAKQTHQAMMCRKEEVTVRDVAYLYAQTFARIRREQAEIAYLSPYGLDLQTFVSCQRKMNQSLVERISLQLENARLAVETLIIGVDGDGAHIYHIYDPGKVVCRDRAAFWAIGSGSGHFESLFMSLSYDRQWPIQNAMLLMYSAKRKAELAPGVGRATDIVYISMENGFMPMPPVTVNALKEHYDNFEEKVQGYREKVVHDMTLDNRLFSPQENMKEAISQNRQIGQAGSGQS